LPAFKALYHAWSKQISKEKYSLFTDALQAGINKLSDYYDWTGNSLAHVFAMILNPREKIIHFEKHWSSDLESKKLHIDSAPPHLYSHAKQLTVQRTVCGNVWLNKSLLRELSDGEESISGISSTSADCVPWLEEFSRYNNATDSAPEGMIIVQWWGMNTQQLPVWVVLAWDFLAIIASSVLSERAFSAVRIIISECRNHLKGGITEALQFLKCLLHKDLLFCKPISASVSVRERERSGKAYC
ncbi:hypothetical protein GYMLUDRAFT_181114, partial [Collybiopsis luxurians FD-317 M1]